LERATIAKGCEFEKEKNRGEANNNNTGIKIYA
jgi:hypothetical protein